MARASPGSAPSTEKSTVCGLTYGYSMHLAGRSSTLRMLPAKQSSVKRRSTSPGRTRQRGSDPPNVHAYCSGRGTMERTTSRSGMQQRYRGGQPLDQILAHLDADAWSLRNGKIPILEHERLGDVLCEIAVGRRRVARQLEVRERGEREIGRASDTRLEHAAAPHRCTERGADIVNADGLDVAADASRLDVDDAARTAMHGVGGDCGGDDRLVEADRR